MASARLPRFKRIPTALPLRLTDRDCAIVQQVNNHRFLRSDHITNLVPGSSQQITRRLQQLFHHGFLERPECQINYYQSGSRRMAYGLGNKGAMFLKRALNVPSQRIDWPTRNCVGRLFLEHALLVSDVMVALELACEARPNVRLIDPSTLADKKIRSSFQWAVTISRNTQCGVIPDRVFGIEHTSESGKTNRCWYFLEADRATMPVTRDNLDRTSFYRKLLAYHATWKQNVHRSKLGFDRFRVLTVTTNAERVHRLIECCSQLPSGRGLFLFADTASLSSGNDMLTMTWHSGQSGVQETLV